MDQITTYATLQAAVAGMLHRTGDTGITDNAPLFIQLCEAELNSRLLLKDTEEEDTLSTTQGVNYIALPAGFISPLACWIVVDDVRTPLIPKLPQFMAYDSEESRPCEYAIDGANLLFDCPADAVYSVPLRYVKASNLSNSNTSNALLLRRPDVYLYGSLYQASLYAQDDGGAQKWKANFEAAIVAEKRAQNRARAQVALETDIGTRSRTNILTG